MTRAAWSTLALALLLGLFAARLLHSAQQNAFTLDEPHYVGTGLYLWESGDYHYFRSLRFQPPLGFHLASLPLLFLDLPDQELGFDLGTRLIAATAGPERTALRVATRVPFVLVAVLGALVCFLWAREAAGEGAGWLAALLYTANPSILAHGAIVHSDLLVSVLTTATLYLLWRWWQRPSPWKLVACGGALGLAMLAKLSAILLVGTVGVLVVLAFLPGRPVHAKLPALSEAGIGERSLAALRAGALLLAVALVVLWVGYGGSFAFAETPEGRFAGMRLPAWVQSFLFADRINSTGRLVYFLGEFSSEGWWSFFPVAFAIKEPVAFVLLTVAAVLSLRSRRQRLGCFLAVPFAIYGFILVVWVEVPLGYRYALPLLPLLCVFIATQLSPLGPRWRRAAVAGALLVLFFEGALVHPHYLGHFNALVGGPSRGHHYLLDANVDWGQDVTTLARELERRGQPRVWLALYSAEDPNDHGVRGRRYTGCEPVAGWLAISANVRMGLYRAGNPLAPPIPGCYAWLDAYEPVAIPGGSILLYELPTQVAPATRDSPAASGTREPPG